MQRSEQLTPTWLVRKTTELSFPTWGTKRMGVSLIVMEAGEELVLSGERQQQTLILASISEGGTFWQVRKVLDVQT